MEKSIPRPRHSTRVCVPCKDQKRKCDKVLPICSLCSRIGRKCRWDTPPSSADQSTAPSPVTYRSGDSSDCDPKTLSLAMHLSILTNNGSNLYSIITQYMETIHPYFPIVSGESLNAHIPALLRPLITPCGPSNNASSDVPLLFLSLLLITAIPAKSSPGLSSESKALYSLVKTSIALLEADPEQPSSGPILQARAVVTLFEVGHGLRRAAWISIAALARAAEEAGFAKGECGDWRGSLWWGIVVLDRYISLEAGRGPRVTTGLGGLDRLPGEPDIIAPPNASAIKELHIPIYPSPKADPFERLAQASHILDLVLTHVYNPLLYVNIDLEAGIDLMKKSTALNVVLVAETTQVTAVYSGAIGIVNTAFMALISACLDYPNTTQVPAVHTLAIEYLRPLLHEIVASCSAFLCSFPLSLSSSSSSSSESIESLSPFVPLSLFKAACFITVDACGDGEEWCQISRGILRGALGKMGERWDSGRRYAESLDSFQEEYLKKKS